MRIKIYIGYNEGLPNVERSIKTITDSLNVTQLASADLSVIKSSPDKYEYPALDKCWEDSQNDEFYGLYLHCKGASKQDETEFLNGTAWLEYMLYGLVTNHELCTEHMVKGADLVGCMWYRHFKGNCFWFKSSYVKDLMRPMALNVHDRYMAEYWCSQVYWWKPDVRLPKVKNLFYLPINTDADFLPLRRSLYAPRLQTDTVCTNLPQVIASADYSVYDSITLTAAEYERYKSLLAKYTNYDSTITITNIQ